MVLGGGASRWMEGRNTICYLCIFSRMVDTTHIYTLHTHNVSCKFNHTHSHTFPFWGDRKFGPQRFEPWSSQITNLKNDTCYFLGRRSLGRGLGVAQRVAWDRVVGPGEGHQGKPSHTTTTYRHHNPPLLTRQAVN